MNSKNREEAILRVIEEAKKGLPAGGVNESIRAAATVLAKDLPPSVKPAPEDMPPPSKAPIGEN